MIWLDTALKILLALGGIAGVSSLFVVRAQKRQMLASAGMTDAQADTAFAEAYHRRAATQVSLIEPYERSVARLEDELNEALDKLDQANDKIDRLTMYVETLVDAMRRSGTPVPPMPPPPVPHEPRSRTQPRPIPGPERPIPGPERPPARRRRT